MLQSRLQNLLQTQVSRQDFLKMSLLAAGSVLGFGTAIKLVTGKQPLSLPAQRQAKGYGTSPYGK